MSDWTAVLLFWVPVGIIVYHWVGFPLMVGALSLMRHRAETRASSAQPRSVTIAVAAYNEAGLIREKIRNSLAVDYPPDCLEVLVGSDGSDDGTDSIVRSYGDPRVRLLRLDRRSGKPSVLNVLIGEATGDLVLFTDADVELDAQALRSMVERFADPNVGAVHAHYRRVNRDGSPAESLFDRYEAVLKNLEGRLGAMVGAYGWALMVRRKLCEALPEDTVLDDFLIGVRPFRRGYAVVYEPTALCCTRVEAERLEFLRKARISRGNVQALARNADLLLPKYGVKAWVLFSHKLLRMVTPFALVSMLVGTAVKSSEPLFMVAFALQCVVLLTVPLLSRVQGCWRRLFILQYFYYMNAALVVGYWQFVTKRDKFWRRTPRV